MKTSIDPTVIDLDALRSVTGGWMEDPHPDGNNICSQRAVEDRHAHYDRYASTIAYDQYCFNKQPNSYAASELKSLYGKAANKMFR